MKIKLSDTANLEIKDNKARVNDGVWHQFCPTSTYLFNEEVNVEYRSSNSALIHYNSVTLIAEIKGSAIIFRNRDWYI